VSAGFKNEISIVSIFGVIFFISWPSESELPTQISTLSSETKTNLNFFRTKTCVGDASVKTKASEISNKLIFIDTTDPLNDNQIQFIRDNFVTGVNWKHLGDRFTIVILNNKPSSAMDFVSLCAPVPSQGINSDMAKLVQEKQIRIFKKTFSEVFDVMVKSDIKAKQTHLIESIVEIYRNKRFNFLNGNRELIIASDLFQHSDLISFYSLCKNKQCPSFAETMQNTSISSFINNEAKFVFKSSDKIEIFHLKSQDRAIFSIKPWWQDFFKNAGLTNSKLKVTSQLD
jgi:hypothetical protein